MKATRLQYFIKVVCTTFCIILPHPLSHTERKKSSYHFHHSFSHCVTQHVGLNETGKNDFFSKVLQIRSNSTTFSRKYKVLLETRIQNCPKQSLNTNGIVSSASSDYLCILDLSFTLISITQHCKRTALSSYSSPTSKIVDQTSFAYKQNILRCMLTILHYVCTFHLATVQILL